MRLNIFLFCQCWLLIITPGTSIFNEEEERKWVSSIVELVELDLEDHCEILASSTWDMLTGKPNARVMMLEREKSYGLFARTQSREIRESTASHIMGPQDVDLERKVKLLREPGDTMLESEDWIKMMNFGEALSIELQFATDYNCGTDTNCTFPELERSLAKQTDEKTSLKMKESWEKKLPDETVYFDEILPILSKAANANNYSSAEEYWNMLVEYEGAMLKARELWDQVKFLYEKLLKYVALRLKGKEAMDKPLPVHLLRSLQGDDWSNVIEALLPKHPDIYQKVLANLQLKNVGGREAFTKAAELIESLNFGPLNEEFWTTSKFDGSCATNVLDYCKPNKVKVYTCKDVSIGNYIDAYEAAMSVKSKEVVSLHSNNTFMFRSPNRYSAFYEAVPGVISLLALTPHALDKAGLYDLHRFNYNPNHHRLILQLIIALRDLPKLNFYLAADEWRLKNYMVPSEKEIRWQAFRRNFSKIEVANGDFLGDSYVLLNKPYIGKFMGLILKYQIYQSFAEELYGDDDDLIRHIAENNHRLMEPISKGYSVIWPVMVSDLLANKEYGLESTGLTDYFRLLDEYLDKQLDSSMDYEEADYVEPPIEEENEIPQDVKATERTTTDVNILDNIIDVDDKGAETSTIGAMEVKKQVPVETTKEDEPQGASYNTYWWLAIGLLLSLAVVICVFVYRKRNIHRKQLERQRETRA